METVGLVPAAEVCPRRIRILKVTPLLRKWFPVRPDRSIVGPALEAFYARNAAYHEMTAAGNKADHPQVRLLSCLIRPGETYAEIGCGGGAVCRAVAGTAHVIGFDVSPLAIEKAGEACAGLPVRLACAPAEHLPLADSSVAGSFSFEVMEHLWDPVAAAREMVRITRSGGFILLSMPSRFSLDLHLTKTALAHAADLAMALVRWALDRATRAPYVNVNPALDGEVHPDCDMVSAVVPQNLAAVLETLDCRVEFWDAFYMCAHRQGSATTLDFQRNAARRWVRHFGDHILLLARKR